MKYKIAEILRNEMPMHVEYLCGEATKKLTALFEQELKIQLSSLRAEAEAQEKEVNTDNQIIEYLRNKYYPVARSKSEAFHLIKDFLKPTETI